MNVLFYKSVLPLNSETHRSLHLQPYPNDYSFARTTPVVPLATTEFFAACRHYPILFSGDDASLVAVAVMGYSEDRNNFINDKNEWQAATYIPAFVRRYPFILAHGSDENRQTLCFDEQWKGFNEDGEGEALFTTEGEQTEHLKNILTFVESLHLDMQRSQPFIQRLLELQLLDKRDLQINQPNGASLLLKDFRIINEKAFMELDDSIIVEFHKKGWLPWVYSHLLSLSNLGR